MRYERIRDLREDHGLIQMEIAKVLCINQNTYSAYESGMIYIPIDALIKLADFYDTSIDYLVGRTDKKEFEGKWKDRKRITGKG